MAEEMKQELSAEEAEQLALVENDRDALSALVDDLSGHSRRKRQMAAHVMLLVAQREPELLSEFIPDLIDALYRPEAQTRWEILDALTLLVPEHAKEIGAAFDGAEAALFDDLSSILHFSAFRLLVTWGATERGRSKKVWPILDEAENGKGSYLKARSSEIYNMLVKRFKLEKPQKRARMVAKTDEPEDDEE